MKVWLKVAVSLGILALLLWWLPWEDVVDSVRRLPGSVWLSVLVCFLTGHLLGSFKWGLLIRTLGAPLGWRESLRCYAAGLFANLCLPGIVGGDVVRAAAATRSSGRVEAVILGSVGDRAIDTVALATVMGLGSLVAGSQSADNLLRWTLLLVAAGLATAAVVLMVLLRRPLMSWPRRLRRPMARALVALRRLARSPMTVVTAFVLALVIQSGFVLLNAWIGRCLGVTVSSSVWFVVWPMAKLAGLMPISLGGLGVRDATLGALLAGFGTPVTLGVVTSLIWQSILIVGGLLAGLYWWIASAAGRHD